MQTFALLQVVECHVASEDPIQEQRNPGGDELMIYTIGAEWLCRKTYSIFDIGVSGSFLSVNCPHADITSSNVPYFSSFTRF